VGATVAAQFPDAAIVLYGHTHKRHWERLPDGRWLLNPGSLMWPRDDGPGGLAIMHLGAGDPQVQWVDLA
jgi:predicted phosphodiesterase